MTRTKFTFTFLTARSTPDPLSVDGPQHVQLVRIDAHVYRHGYEIDNATAIGAAVVSPNEIPNPIVGIDTAMERAIRLLPQDIRLRADARLAAVTVSNTVRRALRDSFAPPFGLIAGRYTLAVWS